MIRFHLKYSYSFPSGKNTSYDVQKIDQYFATRVIDFSLFEEKKKGMDYCEIFNDNKHTKMLEIEITSLYWSKYCLIMS